MLKEIWNWLTGKKEKVEPPESGHAIIKMSEIAKENGIIDDSNRIIELHRYGKVKNIKYSDADVDALREQGIPVLPEEYSDEYEFFEESMGGVDFKR